MSVGFAWIVLARRLVVDECMDDACMMNSVHHTFC